MEPKAGHVNVSELNAAGFGTELVFDLLAVLPLLRSAPGARLIDSLKPLSVDREDRSCLMGGVAGLQIHIEALERLLVRHPMVRSASVRIDASNPDSDIVAFVVSRSPDLTERALARWLRQTAPVGMLLPSTYAVVLPPATEGHDRGLASGSTDLRPLSACALPEVLATVWAPLLGVPFLEQGDDLWALMGRAPWFIPELVRAAVAAGVYVDPFSLLGTSGFGAIARSARWLSEN
jgi:hypothetical protein